MLSYIMKFRKSENYSSYNQIDDVWSMILQLSDINFLRKKWNDRNDDDYIFVSTALKQSHEYYLASKYSSMKTRPLLLYYCFLNLTKAILFIHTDQKPPRFHGLCKEDIDKNIEVSTDMLFFSAETNNGIFLELGKAYNWEVPKNLKITFDDFIRNNIELIDGYFTYFGRYPYFIYPKIDGFMNGELKVTVSNYEILSNLNISFDDIINKFKMKSNVDEVNISNNILTITYKILDKEKDNKKFLDKSCELLENIVQYSVLDNGYYINVAPEEKNIPNANTYFGIMFILSSIVRYKPEHIYKLVDDKDTSVGWFLKKICDISERSYPNLMLNLIYNNDIVFSS